MAEGEKITTPLSEIENKMSIQFFTIEEQNSISNSYYTEGHEVGLESATDSIALVTEDGSKNVKFVIKLVAGTPYYLKFHLPQDTLSRMYVTFCVKNDNFVDGYADYKKAVDMPEAYINALVQWCNGTQNIPNTVTTREKILKFNFKGRITGGVTQSRPFTVAFQYQVGETPPPINTSINPEDNAQDDFNTTAASTTDNTAPASTTSGNIS